MHMMSISHQLQVDTHLFTFIGFLYWGLKMEVKLLLIDGAQSMSERRSWAPLVFSRARVERRSRFSLKSASWAPLVIFIEERKMSAAQILNFKV